MAEPTGEPVVIVGAGVSGLACARALASAGRRVLLLERARGVGGRCATRRLEGQPLDHGVAFLHGRDPEFLAALREVKATAVPGWPARVSGSGRPCQPDAFTPGEERLSFAEGVSVFPKHLAAGLDVRLEVEVAGVEAAGAAVRVRTAGGEILTAGTVVLALAAEQAQALLAAVPGAAPEVASARALLRLSRSQPCLALLALYPGDVPPPDWQVCYPESSRVLQLLSHDSSKRRPPAPLAMVFQAHPAWSRAHLEDPAWPEAVLAEAARLAGPWAVRPSASHPHRWRYARNDRSAELAGPVLLSLPGGARLGLCGDRFAPGGGVEAAWRSGRMLAGRILAEEGGS